MTKIGKPADWHENSLPGGESATPYFEANSRSVRADRKAWQELDPKSPVMFGFASPRAIEYTHFLRLSQTGVE